MSRSGTSNPTHCTTRPRLGSGCRSAGPGHARTFIVDRIADVTLLPGVFDRPDDLDRILAADRAPVDVNCHCRNAPTGSPTGSPLIDRGAGFRRRRPDGPGRLLPPVAERVGLILIIAGADSFVLAPEELGDAETMSPRRCWRITASTWPNRDPAR